MSDSAVQDSPPIELLFLGTGTSAGVPMIGCHCDVCQSHDPRDKRTRCSVVIHYGGKSVLIDTSPELRLQAVANRVDRIDAIVFTHAHADHIMGLDDARRFNAILGGPLDVFADPLTMRMIQQCFDYAFREPKPEWKLFRPHLNAHLITGLFEIFGQRWTPIPLIHGEGSVLGFRVGNLAYCTDASAVPPESRKLMQGLDVLVLDALQDRKHPTHLTIDEALAVVEELRPRETWFTHMSHQVMHATVDPRLPEGVRLAFDGLRVTTLR
ncbi:MAG TPA: MBL fold metallo-hydrolase [Tepidisphaeraceae bacterium]|nr:MBL fold metallo-hydrolase [Tepidisphaeraceae bacterium]